MDVQTPTLLDSSADIHISSTESMSPASLKATSSSGSNSSDGQLNRAFKFGGMPKARIPAEELQACKEVSLSDIKPPPSHDSRSQSSSMPEDEDSVMNSILAKATELPLRERVDSSSKRQARDPSTMSSTAQHARQSSALSFVGFESFEAVRRGFAFHDNRSRFHPPPHRRQPHGRHESVFRLASISSYGAVVNPGIPDPFDYGLPALHGRPSSEDLSMSMSMSVDGTFSFLDHQQRRKRVDIDSSSFYPRPTAENNSRSHRRNESNLSIVSQGPPISLYNRSSGHHRRNDSNTSGSSVAHSYAMYGANGGRLLGPDIVKNNQLIPSPANFPLNV